MAVETDRIVLIDDNRYVHVQFERALASMSENLCLQAFSRAAEAQAVLVVEKPALLFLDVLMPDKDGFTFLGDMRRLALQRSTSVVMMASADYQQNRRMARELAVVEFLIKPFPTQRIVSVIRQYIGSD